MSISSVNFQPVKNTSQSHNLRLREFDYVRKDLKSENKNYTNEIPHEQITEELKELVKLNTGRSAQAKAVFIKEGVFLIKPEHTNEQLLQFAQNFSEKFNVRLLELHIHRDEGHWDENKVWKPNLHAHILIENINRQTGKSTGWVREDMIKIQDFFAENLDMTRGKKSSKKHIPALAYKLKTIDKNIAEREKLLLKKDVQLESKIEFNKKYSEDFYIERDKLHKEIGDFQKTKNTHTDEYSLFNAQKVDLNAINTEVEELVEKIKKMSLTNENKVNSEFDNLQNSIALDFAFSQTNRSELNSFLRNHSKFSEWQKLKQIKDADIPKIQSKIVQIKPIRKPGMRM